MQQQVIDAFVAAVKAGSTRAGAAVVADRVDPAKPVRDDMVFVMEDQQAGEDVESGQTVHGLEKRTLPLRVDCVLGKSDEDAAEQARAFGMEVEKAVKNTASGTDEARALRVLCRGGVFLTNSRLVDQGQDRERTTARAQTWQLVYFVKPGAPDLAV